MRRHRRSLQPNTVPGRDARVDVGRHEARRLWQLVEEVAEHTGASPLETLGLDGSLDVSLGRRGRRAEVTVGFPLLEALPASEVRALLVSGLAAGSRRHALGLTRSDGAAPDRAAAEAAGSVVVAAAIVRAELVRRVLDEDYWPAVFHGTQSSAQPHVKPFALLRRTLRAHVESGALRAHARQLFGVDAVDELDRGPSLGDRLRTLGVTPRDAVDVALLPVAAPAADLLGGAYEPLLARLDDAWSECVDEWWERAHADALSEALGAVGTPARTWTQATALARYRETLG
jgi:hypothetical protein